ncbi:MAG: uroporphyrinogen-III C-methyltransferase [Gammaproteobacteria bacterium]|nr:uroporphyrinogen-III C-methyltransferase [Gammaproteobacteria bacterium]
MSEEDPKPGVVIDVTPEQENDATERAEDAAGNASPDSATTRPQPSPKGGLGALLLALLALVAVIVAGVFGYRYWTELASELAAMDMRVRDTAQQQQQLQQALGDATSALKQQESSLGEQRDVLAQQRLAVDEARNAFKLQEQKLSDENVRLQEREGELRAAVADVHRRVGRSGTQWIIAEAEYLLRIANHRLNLARDTDTARVALELADQRLRDTRDPGWAGVREMIAREIARLSTFDAPDSAGLSARLSALIEQIPQLKIARATIGPERTLPERVAREPDERSWQTLLDDLWAGFKDSVRIRERDKPVQAMLAPESQFFLYENLKLHLEAARLAVARNDTALFRENLDTANDWLGRYFEPGDATAGALRSAIAEMKDVDLRPALPDLSQSLRALQARKQLLDDVAPTTSAVAPAAQGGVESQ